MRISQKQLRGIIREELSEAVLREGFVDKLQLGLDVVGMIPGVGEVADAANAIISVARGNHLQALLSVISMIPAAGDAVGKGGKTILKALEPVMDMITAGAEVAEVVEKNDPKALEAIKPAIGLFSKVMIANNGTINKILGFLEADNIAAVASQIGIKTEIPKSVQFKIKEIIEEEGGIDIDGIKNIIKFIEEMS